MKKKKEEQRCLHPLGPERRPRKAPDEPDYIVCAALRETTCPSITCASRSDAGGLHGRFGIGKSSLAFDTSMPRPARYVRIVVVVRAAVSGPDGKPKYDQLRGLSPTIAIEQKSGRRIRLDGGTATEIYDYLRVL